MILASQNFENDVLLRTWTPVLEALDSSSRHASQDWQLLCPLVETVFWPGKLFCVSYITPCCWIHSLRGAIILRCTSFICCII